MRLLQSRPLRWLGASVVAAAALAACGGGEDTIELEFLGRYSTGQFGVSAAEIPAYDAGTQRVFVVNAQSGRLDVLDLSDPAEPVKVGEVDANTVLAGATVNSVAVHKGLVAVAIEAPVKTDPGRVALYRAKDLALLGSVTVGALPDMLVFTPNGKRVLVANEGEPSDDYQTDPEGSVSVIDVSNPTAPSVQTADFSAFNAQAAILRDKGVRLYGPNASVAQDLEPEYIAIEEDGKTAWATLQENNALARIDIASAKVTAILPLGYKDYGQEGNELDASDADNAINIRTWPGVVGMYQPDAIATYKVKGRDYLVTANEGDSRAWGEDNSAYWAGDATKGFVEEFRVKHLVNKNGWAGRAGDDLPPQLNALAAGGLLDPITFGYCGAVAGNPGNCRADDQLGRLNISWTQGYRKNTDGTPMLFNASGLADVSGNRLMYDKLYSYGARSFSIWDDKGKLVWDSGADFEKFFASDLCKLGTQRNIPCATYFNSGHDEGDAKDSRSDAKGPEPEGVALGRIGDRTLAFIGLERFGGVLVYDITDPKAPVRLDYLNTRDEWLSDPPDLATAGDLGPEGLTFIPAKQSPNGKPLLVVGNEVSGTTAVFLVKVTKATPGAPG
ncbi:MAG: choice-of-anchor I family protein [Hydrogenophaga sp.]|uniref:choice-of-anchor I family protein n=1 Tax=Hydrogenophaga sp. TaxID=1904254 RepID=UPI001DF05C61|nr:choice-of-anchor I family protein [Hydrogenophaga sp.]MBX3611101.1 choice-of-anchor I family protein [Hydrogenophaga sp.]